MNRNLFMIALLAASPARGEGSAPVAPATNPASGGTITLDARLRYEEVSQGNALESAQVATVRARLGFTTVLARGFDSSVEFEGVSALDPARYNSTVNGNTSYPVVADPDGSEWNQVWLRYSGIAHTAIKAGRQRLVLDNARFIGNVGWRQNEATYDGVTLVTGALPNTTVSALHLTDVNSIVFSDIRMKADGVHVLVAPAAAFKVAAYGLWLDFEDPVAARRDTRTLGARLAGEAPAGALRLLYGVEFAHQAPFADAPAAADAGYVAAEAGVALSGVTARLGYEALGGDGIHAFQTPLATLHAFQGWADMFLATPANGVCDAYASVAGTAWSVGWLAVWHDFRADRGGQRYGTEVDLQATRTLAAGFSTGVKFADYRSDGFAVDTRKLWFWLQYAF